MSSTSPQFESSAGEELAAYLDGELSADQSRRLEERLAGDDDLRRQLREFDQAWEALAALPQPTARDSFARTTMEMVAMAADRDLSERTATIATSGRRRRILAVAIGLAVVAAAFTAVRARLSATNRLLVQHLPVIMQVDLLTHIEDVNFLRRLSQSVSIPKLVDDDNKLQHDLAQIQFVSAQPPHEREPWIEKLPPEDKAALAAQANRFRARDDQQRLEQRQQEIAAAEDAEQLQRTLLAYGQWLSRHSPGERAELSTLPTDKRLRRIEQLIAEDGRQASRQLSPDESDRLRQEIYAIAEQRKPQVMEQLRRRGAFEKLQERGVRNLEERIRNLDDKTALFIAVFTLMNSDAAEPTRKRLIEQLSPESRSHLEKTSRPTRRGRDWQLVRWMRESLEPQRGPEALERFFSEQLDNDQRARLLSLPQHEMEDELERLYLGDQLGLPSPEWLQGFMDRDLFLRNIPGPGQPPRRGPEDQRRDRGPDGLRRPWRDYPPEDPPPHRSPGMPPPKPGDQQQPI